MDDDNPGPQSFYGRHKERIHQAILLLLFAGWLAYLGYATYYALAIDPDHDVVWYYWSITGFGVICKILGYLSPYYAPAISSSIDAYGAFHVCLS